MDPAPERFERIELDDDVILARHAELTARDHVIGLEAEVVRLEQSLLKARKRLRRQRERADRAESELAALRASRAWRIGRALTSPARRRR